jgi:hypothetical protein
MAAVSGAGSGSDKVHLDEGFTPAVAGTVEDHATVAAAGAATAAVPVMPDGIDPISAEIATRMSTWEAEQLAAMGLVGAKGARLGQAAGAVSAGINAADVENAATINASSPDG